MTSWLVVGLGNPGPAFAAQRHNIGYRVAEELARRMGVRFRVARGIRAEVVEGRVGQPAADAPRLIVAKSRTFMNETGWAVTRLLAYYRLQPAQMIVVHDELDIDPGQLRVKFGGGDNGHNGLRSSRWSCSGWTEPRTPSTAEAGMNLGAVRPTGARFRPVLPEFRGFGTFPV